MAGLDLSTASHFVHQLHHPSDFNLQRQPDDIEVNNKSQFSDDHHHGDSGGHRNQGREHIFIYLIIFSVNTSPHP